MKVTLEHLAGWMFLAGGYFTKYLQGDPAAQQELHLTGVGMMVLGGIFLTFGPSIIKKLNGDAPVQS